MKQGKHTRMVLENERAISKRDMPMGLVDLLLMAK